MMVALKDGTCWMQKTEIDELHDFGYCLIAVHDNYFKIHLVDHDVTHEEFKSILENYRTGTLQPKGTFWRALLLAKVSQLFDDFVGNGISRNFCMNECFYV